MSLVDRLLPVLTLVAALGCGVVAGVFFAFSTFVMRALARLPSGQGLAAMKSINVVVLNVWFLGAFLGTALVCFVVLVLALLRWSDPGTGFVVSGGMLYLGGSLLVTMVFNVPRNNALASVEADASDADERWRGYVAGWTAWNHVRTAASLAAAASFSLALAG